jgi:hypothetical protein
LGTPAQIDLADGYETGPPFTVKLWGERRPGQDKWLDLRIPRELAYPWPTADRFIGLTLIPYRQNGRVAFTRLTGLARWPAGDAL